MTTLSRLLPQAPVLAPRSASYGLGIFLRSRGLPLAATTLLGIALLTALAAYAINAYIDPGRRVPIVALAPMFAAAAIGASLHQYAPELDRTASVRLWPWRLGQLVALTVLAGLTLTVALPGHLETFGPPAIVRNLLGATGLTAGAATVIGARLSWLPTFGYFSAVYLASGNAYGRLAVVWEWPVQPGLDAPSWIPALGAFLLGGALLVVHGARPEGSPRPA